jgi:hypothetical protein
MKMTLKEMEMVVKDLCCDILSNSLGEEMQAVGQGWQMLGGKEQQ